MAHFQFIGAALRAALLFAFIAGAGCSNKEPTNPSPSSTLYRSGEIEAVLPKGWTLFEDEWLVANHQAVVFDIPGGGTATIAYYLPQGDEGVEVPDLNGYKRFYLEEWIMHPDGYGAVRQGGKVTRGSYEGEYVAIEPVPQWQTHDRFEFFSLNVEDTRSFIVLDIPAPIRKDQREETEAFLTSIKIRGQGIPTH